MKVISFNVNGIRARLHQLQAIIETHQPDVIGLQEIKVSDEQFPLSSIQEFGYEVSYYGEKSHYGVALLSKTPLTNVVKGFPYYPSDEQQRRFIAADYSHPEKGKITIINGYFPQGESRSHPAKFPAKQQFYADLLKYLTEYHTPNDDLIIMGDMNISHTDLDIGIGADNAKRWLRTGKCSFLPEEREWLQTILDWGLQDSFRQFNPSDSSLFSWFDYRSRGFEREPKRGLRIDLILASASLMSHCQEVGIDYNIRGMDKPSDHCPIWAIF
ncbi:exodeoxyribonuclease III [Endozoicomonas sp. SM1973]|uniref:Exodeoxyribonuclease III n=1 Tax=Spartinivicinus marinus TaxID=2994442 RepID=A0A853I2S8_9GAMM|nr:exodeoxyribonuclease III [Spartinivicinus marinus]MCX4029454.1 exodeoxyribonuclease III [Spartinivicinus marinus]NYZ65028.1 exodeoxyribonuclease III [Spartinivicinus marinus]